MVGNTILLKHASMVPQCGIAMEELFKAQEGLYTNLLISGRRSTALVSDGVSLTGESCRF
jgi:succinate-semialdehyde dehydrogenase/glutarate-semialdehyde dehydrogenase